MKRKKINNSKYWVITITLIAFAISLILSLISELIIPNTFIIINIILVLLFIFLGIIFDIIGLAVATAEEKPFHAMATKKVRGSKKAIKFIKNKDRVSSFCNDVIGDICGVLSGSCGLSIAIKLSSITNINLIFTTITITSLISALTIGGKALGKQIAVSKSNEIVYTVTKILSIVKKD